MGCWIFPDCMSLIWNGWAEKIYYVVFFRMLRCAFWCLFLKLMINIIGDSYFDTQVIALVTLNDNLTFNIEKINWKFEVYVCWIFIKWNFRWLKIIFKPKVLVYFWEINRRKKFKEIIFPLIFDKYLRKRVLKISIESRYNWNSICLLEEVKLLYI